MASLIPSWFWGFLDSNSSNFPTLIRTISVVRGIRCIITPGSQYYEFGVPREGSDDPLSKAGSISPLMFVKGIREIGYGVSMEMVGRLHDQRGVTGLLAVGAVMSACDAVVVAVFGRGRSMVLLHLLTALYFGAMAYLRL